MGELEIAREKGHIDAIPCYSTICRFMQRDETTSILSEIVMLTSLPLKNIETLFAVDSTGFGTNYFQRWYSFKYGKEMKSKKWIKCHFISGVKTNIITGVKITSEYEGDSPQFAELIEQTASHFNIINVFADKAYSSVKSLEMTVSAGAVPYIPFKINAKPNGKGAIWKKLYNYFMFKQNEFYKVYHLRSNAETTIYMIKSKFGNFVRSRTWTAQVNEVLCKVICHNICVIIQEMRELGIKPDFNDFGK
jgi:transposase